MQPFIDKKMCAVEPDICKAMRACPEGAFHYVSDEKEPAGGRMAVDETLCTSCGLCASACCGDAVEMR